MKPAKSGDHTDKASIPYPKDIQTALDAIMEHRRRIKRNAKSITKLNTVGIFSLELAGVAVGYAHDQKLGPEDLMIGATMGVGLFGVVGYAAYSKHFREYQEEYANLYRAIHNPKNEQFMRAHFPTSTAKYWTVDSNGKLIPKQRNPTIFGRPLGRRRIPNNVHERKVRSKETWMRKPMRGRTLHW